TRNPYPHQNFNAHCHFPRGSYGTNIPPPFCHSEERSDEVSLLSPTKLRRQILPTRIQLLYQSHLLLSPQTLDLCFPRNRVANVLKSLKIYQSIDSVLLGKARDLAQLVFNNSAIQDPWSCPHKEFQKGSQRCRHRTCIP